MAYIIAPRLPLKLLLEFVSAQQLASAIGQSSDLDVEPDLTLSRIGLFRISDLNDVVLNLAAEGVVAIINEERRFRLDWPNPGDLVDASMQWHLKAIGFDEGKRLVAGNGIRIGLIDTGVDSTHPEFAADVVDEAADITSTDANPLDPAQLTDTDGHGTQVASLAVGRNLGLAPAARLVVARLAADAVRGYATAGAVCQAINWLMSPRSDGQPRAHIINMSLVCDTLAPADLNSLFSGLGIKRSLVAASGNWGAHCQDSCGLPARMPDVLAVGATWPDGSVWADSGWGFHADTQTPPNYVPKPNLHAPGINVVTARPPDPAYPGAVMYRLDSGTSMSSGLVSGALAALYSAGYSTPRSARFELLRLGACLRTKRPGGIALSLRGL